MPLFSLTAIAQVEAEHYENAIQAYDAGEYSEAYIHLKNALQVDPGFIPARVLLAKVYFNAGDVDDAAKEAEEALELGADLNLVLSVYGTSLLLQGRVEDLLALEERSDELSAESEFDWTLLKGQAALMQGEPEAARREFERAAEMAPDDARSLNTLASAYLQSSLQIEASDLIVRSLKLDPNNPKTLELSAELAIAQGRLADAQQSLERAHELDSEDLRVLRGLARVHLLRGNEAELQQSLDMILELSPEDPAAMLLKAIAEINRGEVELGDDMLSDLSLRLSEVDSLLPRSSDQMIFIQASADYVRGSDRTAIDLLIRYLRRRPGDLLAIRMLSDLYVRNGENAQARELLSDNQEAVYADPGLSILLLQLYMSSGRELSARELLSELKSEIDDPVTTAILEAELNRSVGKPEDALELLPERDYGEVPLSYGLLRGALLLDVGRVGEAQLVAEQLQKHYPGRLKVQNFAAVAYLRGNDQSRADKAVKAALAISGTDVEANFNRAMALKRRGELEQASVVLNQVLLERPDHIRSILLMATILHQQGRSDEAIDWSKKVYAYDKTSLLPNEFQLKIYTQQENWQEALKTSTQLTRAAPLNESYLLRQAEICMAMGDYELAQRSLRSLFSLWEDNPVKLRQLAQIQASTQNLPEARLSLETALKADPESFDTRLELARLDVMENNFDAAGKKLAALEKAHGQRSGIDYAQGEIALAQNDLVAAQAHFMQAFKLDWHNANAVVRLYELSSQGVGRDELIAALESTLRDHSLPPWAVRMLADSYMGAGQPRQAARYYEMLLQHPGFGQDAGVLNNLANIYAEEDLDKALDTAMSALDAEEDDSAAVLDTVGWIMTRQEEYEKALPYLRKAYSLNSRDPEIRYHIAVALVGLGRESEAVNEVKAALKSRDDFNGRAEAERLLATLSQ